MTGARLRGLLLATVAAGLASLTSGCAVLGQPLQTAALNAAAPADLPRQVERTQVPFFPQTPLHCGPAALATVLADVGLPADLDRLTEAVFLPARGGSLQLEMLSGARRQGAVATVLPGELQALLREVAAGHAVVVLQNLGLSFAPRWHYAVLVGYDLDAEELVLRSGTVMRERMSLRTFEHTWARGGHWAIAVLPPGQVPASAQEDAAVDAVLGYARVAEPALQVRAWRGVVQRWPDNLLAGVGLGNAASAAGDTATAATAFEAVARTHDSAVAWHNLARTRATLGDVPGARQAADRALARARSAEPGWLDHALKLQSELAEPRTRGTPALKAP